MWYFCLDMVSILYSFLQSNCDNVTCKKLQLELSKLQTSITSLEITVTHLEKEKNKAIEECEFANLKVCI